MQHSARLSLQAALALVTGAALRIVWLLAKPHQIVSDELVYHHLAERLSSGQPFGLEIWPPGWPMVLGLAYSLFGARPLVGMVVNLLASFATMLLVWQLAARLFGARAGLACLWLVALMPSYVLLNVMLGYEVWLQLLLALGYWLVATRGWHWTIALSLGAITALAALVRPFWLLLPPVLALCLHPLRRARLAMVALSLVVALILILPWELYISSQAGQLVPIAMNGGVNLWGGNNPDAIGTLAPLPEQMFRPEADGVLTERALDYIRTHPARVLALLPNKLWYLLSVEAYSAVRYPVVNGPGARVPGWFADHLASLMNVSYWLVALLALCAVAELVWRRHWASLGPLLFFGFNLLCYLPFFGYSRYRWPVQFILLIYAAALLREQRLRARPVQIAGGS